MDRTLGSLAGLLLLLVLFFAVNLLAGAGLRSARIDFTEGDIHTLSAGSRRIAAGVDDTIRLYLYYSGDLAVGRPAIENHHRRVRELLEAYVRASGGTIELELVDPEPFSEAEDEAVQAGLVGAPVGGGTLYFGLVGTNAIDGREVLPFLDPNQEPFLEYEISRLIHTLDHPERAVVAVLSPLPLDGGPPNPMTGQPASPPWQILRELRSLFEVRVIGTETTAIDEDVDVLLVVHPKSLPEAARYAIDQFVLRRGRAIVLVDPHCEHDVPPDADRNPMAALQWPRASALPRLFEAWGIEYDPAAVACDLEHAQRVRYQTAGRPEGVSYVAWLALDEALIDDDDPITGPLSDLNIATAGILRPVPEAATTFQPLVKTGPESASMEASRFAFMPDPKALLNDFEPGDQSLTIAARVTGPVSTAFPGGRPAAAPEDHEHLAASAGDVAIIVVSDVDLLADRFWIQEQRLGQISLGRSKFADNGDLVINAVDNLTGSDDLIAIRGRGRTQRPFTLVQEKRREAEQRYAAEEASLQESLRETETRLSELQRARPDQGQIIATEEQLAEIERFNAKRIDTRKQLRAVRLNLRKDIEALGTRLKIINIILVPALVAVAAVALGLWRVRRRRADRRRAT